MIGTACTVNRHAILARMSIPSDTLAGSGSTYHANMDTADYAAHINTPAGRVDYYEQFHEPVLAHARELAGARRPRMLDIACSPGFELDFIPEDIEVFATDISPDILPEVQRRLGDRAMFFAADASNTALRPGFADAGMMVNAMIYVPGQMLWTMFNALQPGAQCAVNFRSFNNPNNAVFYDHYLERGGILTEADLKVTDDVHLSVVGLDYRGCVTDDEPPKPDEKLQRLGTQTYLGSVGDMVTLVTASGFEIVSHEPYQFPSPVNPCNEVDVFILQKPAA